jgi:hypothetical protein
MSLSLFSTAMIVLPALKFYKKGSYQAVLTNEHNALVEEGTIGETSRSGLLLNLNLRELLTIGALFITAYFAIYVSYVTGKGGAEQRTEFHVIAASPNHPEVVLLRPYGDYLFTAPFNRQTGEIGRTLVILKLSDDSPVFMTLENIGRLKVKPF